MLNKMSLFLEASVSGEHIVQILVFVTLKRESVSFMMTLAHVLRLALMPEPEKVDPLALPWQEGEDPLGLPTV